MADIALASPDDFRAFFGIAPPPLWLAMCCRDETGVKGIAGVIYSEDGTAVGFMDKRGDLPAAALHRAALRFLTVMRRVGEPHIVTYCDETIPRAAAWLKRLGFQETERVVDNKRVWLWRC